MEKEGSEVTRNEFNEVLELARTNNRILRNMQRNSRIRKIISVVYFVLILGIMLYLYYYLQPYIENILASYQFMFSGVGMEQMIREGIQTQSVSAQ